LFPTTAAAHGCVVIATHLIAHDVARAVDAYTTVLGAEKRGRITLPDGRLIDVELAFGGFPHRARG